MAISVAGGFTGSGASLNVNYLIPIGDAIKKLNIAAAPDMSYLFDAIKNKEPEKEKQEDKK